MKTTGGKYFMIILSGVALLIFATALWLYVFSIYEVKYVVDTNDKYDDYNLVTITGNPLNAFGKTVLFRKIENTFEVISGNKSVISSQMHGNEFVLKLMKKGGEKVSVKASCELSLFPTIIDIDDNLK
ncbi:MAG: hypothetical protein CVV23_06670 [Ignavibacteriae bacterium HGW-Ignavibacteriae-2]|nr:MAG: hypothetical protein CVV23_06670 [Ignavibacteriae bacterium HGW-Ignavibacteriae-2]